MPKHLPVSILLCLFVLGAGLSGCTQAQTATSPAPSAPTRIASGSPSAQTPAATLRVAATPAPAATAAGALAATASPVSVPATTIATASPAGPLTAAPARQTATAVAGTAATVPPGPTATRTAVPSPRAAGPADRVGLQLLAEGLTSPVALVPVPDGSGRLFVVDQVGLVRIVGQDGKLLAAPFLDLRDRMVRLNASYDERGLLGLAFHPDYAGNRRFFVFYSAPLRQGGPAGYDNTMTLAEYTASAQDPNRADAGSARIVMQVDEPQANHEGGTITFGPDGYLYVTLGDGGAANDIGAGHTLGLGNGQDLSVPLGKILRIDVNSQGKGAYGIPGDNPFKDGPVPEIYAYGLRNPYRMSFDMAGNQDLIAADVGQNLYEEIDIIRKGGNYGWRIREGTRCFNPSNSSNPLPNCADRGADGSSLIAPVLEYAHKDVGIAVVAGFMYRGKAMPQFAGKYLFGDWSTSFGAPDGTLLVATPSAEGQGSWPFQKLAITNNPNGRLGQFVLGFGQDLSGEVYVLTTRNSGPNGQTGRVLKLVPPG